MSNQVQLFSPESIFTNLKPFLTQEAPFVQNWSQFPDFIQAAEQISILVVGAGGLGCELVKNLALSGIRKIDLIDMDTVDVTNLNRQFLFRQKDIGKFKADIVAQFVMRRCPGVKITTHKKKVQDINFSFYQQFSIIIGGLDNVEARKYLNSVVFQLNRDQEGVVCYYIDGATEGFSGQALVVEPYLTSCYQCSLLKGLGQKPKVNYCTLNTPRTPQHCILYVLEVLWQKVRPNELRDNDNLEHMQWVYEKSLERAKEFKIEGVTEMLTLGVTKNVIPAIASTNALIAAVCTNEALKIASGINPRVDNYMLFKGGSSIGSQTYSNQKLQNCRACNMRINKLQTLKLTVSVNECFHSVLRKIKQQYESIDKPFVNHGGKIFLNPGNTESYESKVGKTFIQLAESKLIQNQTPLMFFLTDRSLKDELRIEITVQDIQNFNLN